MIRQVISLKGTELVRRQDSIKSGPTDSGQDTEIVLEVLSDRTGMHGPNLLLHMDRETAERWIENLKGILRAAGRN